MTCTRPLHLTPFRRLLSGYAVNSVGTWVGEISLAVLVLRETGSAAAVAAVFVAAHLAPAILAPPALLRLERLPTGRALLVLLGLQAGLFATLAALVGAAPFEVVLVISALDGVAAVAARALVKAAIVATTRPAGLLREGNALFSSVFTVCAAFGPLLGGIVVAALGPRVGLALDAGSFAFTALLFAGGDRLPSVCRELPRIGRGMRVGLEHIRGNRPLRRLVTFNLAVTVLAAIIVPVELLFVTETLGADEAAYGAVVTAWGVGMIAGGSLVVVLRRIPLRSLVAASVLTIGASYCAMGSTSSVAAICGFSGLGGVANGVEAYALMTALQEATHDRFQARVGALVESATSAALAIGFLTGGAIATVATPRAAYGVAGGGILIAVAAAALPRFQSRRRTCAEWVRGRAQPALRRAALAGLLAAFAALSVPQIARSHTLGLTKASSFANSMAYDAYLKIGPATRYYGSCLRRLSRHRFACRAWTDNVGDVPDDRWFICRQTAWVEFASRRSRRLVWVYDPARCFGPAMRSPADVPAIAEADAGLRPDGSWRWNWDGPLTEWPTILTPAT